MKSEPTANSYKLCTWSVVRLGLPLLIMWAGPEALKGLSTMNSRSQDCR